MSTVNGATPTDLRLLAFFAHPDDEAFGIGGIMAANKARGIHNTLVCATKGEAGEISLPELATSSNLGLVRELELREAAQHMGVDDLYFLGYRDSGMAGTEPNQHPNAFANANPGSVVPRLVRFIRTVRPQVVVTFDPTGGYGHPDHIAIHKHTVAAFHAAADPAYALTLGEAWQAQRLFYPAFRREMFNELREQLISQGIEPPDWGNMTDLLPQQPIHATVDVAPNAALKWRALKSHRTQIGPKNPFMQVPEEFVLKMMGLELFELAWPDTKPDQPYTDLFEGLAN
jgi:LmbE family N-acetylglucosaminyl deacetylase